MSQAEYELFLSFYDLYYTLLQVALFLMIWNIFYRPNRAKRPVIFAGIFAAVNVLLRLCPGIPGGVRYVLSAVLVLGYCHVRYKGRIEKAVFTLLLFYNFHGMSFLISNSIYQFLMDEMLGRLDAGNAEYMSRLYQSQMMGQGCLSLCYTVSFALLIWILKKIVKRPISMNWQDVVFLSALNVVGGMLTWMVVDLSVVRIDREVFSLFTQRREMVWKLPMMAALLCMGELSAIYIFQRYRELQDERQKHFVEEQQLKTMKRRLEEAEDFYGGIRRVRHEMKSHMTNIKGLVAGEKYEEVERYIGKLDATIQELDYKYSTGNAVTDVIINDKYRQAVKSGIAFTAAFDYRESDTISAFDMGIVLSNLLNNAIEACEKLEQENRYISLVLKRKNRFLLIEVENSFDGELEWREGESVPATRKQDSLPDVLMEHGIGLRNVKDVAERYLGDLNIKAGNGTFKVTVMLQQDDSAQSGAAQIVRT